MKLIDDIRRANIALLEKEMGSLKALAERLEKDESQVSQWKQGSINSGTGKPRGMRSETARYIDERCGKEPGWLDIDHSGSTFTVAPAVTGAPLLSWNYPGDLPDGASVFIPRLTVEISRRSGGAQVTILFVQHQHQTFDTDWIRADQLQPNKLGYIKVVDDSMRPSIWPGDKCVVDTSQTTVVDGKAYAIYYDGGDRIRRLFRLPGGGLRIEADNPAHGPLTVTPEVAQSITILGRIVHRAGPGGFA
ncbi:LexA family transcriptional regulator [Variovorax sp. dw_954]|uniref:S24 family peptidase n=1 Tax=Variovorax sp. dw_954 TaxID=2720078 RepID=UPI001BD484BF|nr:LexA family transcriptional regulator [Variovorax sp. dw_954]